MNESDMKSPRQGWQLDFYVAEGQRHAGLLVYEWLLETARQLGVPGASAFRAAAGYGRHGVLHENTFFELAGDLPVRVSFVLDAAQRGILLDAVARAGLSLFYVAQAVEFGFTGNGRGT